MDLRDLATRRWGAAALRALDNANQRHPWSHNDAFHPWILNELPRGRGLAVDVGCGQGELAAVLAEHFDRVHGVDIDPQMRAIASRRCAGMPNVTVDDTALGQLAKGADLVTMVAVLHHLDLTEALQQVAAMIAPGGRFLCVGLARPVSGVDQLWDLASTLTNPVIGYVRHPWTATRPTPHAPFPTAEPQLSLGQITEEVRKFMPGATVQRRLAFRYTIEWLKPELD